MSESKSGGISFLGLLTLLFIGLKLGGAIDWSWVWILSPFWGPAAVVVTLVVVWLFVNSTRKAWKDNRP